MTNAEELANAFIEALGLARGFDVTTLAYGKHENWDSMAHMQLIAAIERRFDVMIDTEDVIGMSDYVAAVRILEKNGISLGA